MENYLHVVLTVVLSADLAVALETRLVVESAIMLRHLSAPDAIVAVMMVVPIAEAGVLTSTVAGPATASFVTYPR